MMTWKFRDVLLLCVLACPHTVSAQLGGVNTPVFIESKPEALRPAYQKLIDEGARNSVLNNMEIAGVALRIDDDREAADAIDRALLDINRYYGQTQAAANARSLWHEEGAKEFKGEPYERAMAHYYRGMLDLKSGDYGNAQASFASGFLQDAFAEEEQNKSDFAMFAFLAAWALERDDNHVRAEAFYKELQLLKPDFRPPPTEHDTLVVVETGKSPRKLADGIGHAELVYRRGKQFKDEGVTLDIGGPQTPYLMEDIYYQAHTRGARPVDRILEGKIKYRTERADAGAATVELGEMTSVVALMSSDGGLAAVGAGLEAFGALQMFRASNAKPRADTRYWSNLPDRIHIFSYDSKVHGVEDIGVTYLDKNDTILTDMTLNAKRHATRSGGGLVWVFSQH